MIPRNLRKPTTNRVRWWWQDFLRAWIVIGRCATMVLEDLERTP